MNCLPDLRDFATEFQYFDSFSLIPFKTKSCIYLKLITYIYNVFLMKKRATQKKAGLQDSFDQKTIDLSRAETTTEVSPSVPSLESILKFKPLHDDQFLLLQGTQFLHTLQSGISENTYRNFSTLSRSHDEEETDHTSMRKGKKLCFT